MLNCTPRILFTLGHFALNVLGGGPDLGALGRGQMPTTGLNFITNRKFMTKLEEGWGGNGFKYPVCYSLL